MTIYRADKMLTMVASLTASLRAAHNSSWDSIPEPYVSRAGSWLGSLLGGG